MHNLCAGGQLQVGGRREFTRRMTSSSTTTKVLLLTSICLCGMSAGAPLGGYRWMTTAILFPGNEYRIFRNAMSSAKVYSGYFAKVGDKVTINCRTTWAPNTKLTHTSYSGPNYEGWVVPADLPADLPVVANDEQRKTLTEGDEKITLVIHSATVADSGGYWCSHDSKQLRVVDVSNLPVVVNHHCSRSTQLTGLQCWFYTNTSSSNFVTWEITAYNVSSLTNGSEAISVCTEMSVSREGDTGYDKLYCLIGNYRYLDTYTIRIAGQNPFSVEGVTVIDLPAPKKNLEMVIRESQSQQVVNHVFLMRDASPDKYYSGGVAKVGDSVTIRCLAEEPADIIFTDINGTTKIISAASGSLVKEVKSSVEVTDTGRYACGEDFQLLTVIDPSDVPQVLSHQCVSNRFNSLECTFLTNTNQHHLVDWQISFSTRELRSCYVGPCKDISCDEVKVIPADGEQLYDRVTCSVFGWIFEMMTYDLSVKAASPFVSSVVNISTTLDGSIVRPGPPKILAGNVSDISLSLHVQLADVWRFLKAYGIAGFMELAAISHGINFKLEVTELKAGHVKILNSTCNCTSAWLHVPHLKPFTEYSANISVQLARTINQDIWSDAQPFNFTTAATSKWEKLNFQSNDDVFY